MNRTELKNKLTVNGSKLVHEENGYTVIDINGGYHTVFITYNDAGMNILGVHDAQIEIYDDDIIIGNTHLTDINKISYIETHWE